MPIGTTPATMTLVAVFLISVSDCRRLGVDGFVDFPSRFMFVDRFGRPLSFSTFPAARRLLVPKTTLRAIADDAGRSIWQCNKKNVTCVLVVDNFHADLVLGIVFGQSGSA